MRPLVEAERRAAREPLPPHRLGSTVPARREGLDPGCDGNRALSPAEKLALRPFLRCLGVTDKPLRESRWAFIPEERERLALEHFVALHAAFRRRMTFSDVYGDEEPTAAPRPSASSAEGEER